MMILKYTGVCRGLVAIIIAAVLPVAASAQPSASYTLHIRYSNKDSGFATAPPALLTSFAGRVQCMDYVNKLPALLQGMGYAAASVDTVVYENAEAHAVVYLGIRYKWVKLHTDSVEKRALEQSGYLTRNFEHKPFDVGQLQALKERILDYYENNGYPFASVYMDSIQLEEGGMKAWLKCNKGTPYHIDSIRVKGKIKISNYFLQRYLDLPNGSLYSRAKLEQVGRRIAELPFAEEKYPAELQLLGTGSVLNLYLEQRRSSQMNFLIGFLPANNQTNKLQLTGDVNLNLKNAFGAAETMYINWQQLQVKSPRLNIGYQQPYIFKSAFGVDFSFDLFKKDSTFLQLNAITGIQYLLSANQSGKLFFQVQSTTLLASGVDTLIVKNSRRLPANIDVSATSLGLDYEWIHTDYRLNPRSGSELKIMTSAGIKKIKPNDDILNLQDADFNYASLYDSLKLRTYQVRLKLQGAHYFPVGKQATIKAAIQSGIYGSGEIFRNDLFQIGGYRLLRGFDEESIFATQYMVFTAEYRYLLGRNSYLFAFADAGRVQNKYQDLKQYNTFVSTGMGMFFETKAGLLNLSFALGKRDDINFDLRRASKIHFGYINYF
ncbi:MAG TPA: BamA/TamA family outer membrane protein [Ferruginibacter sp.]|nr:BamA/TamA family outer membrane protein [Ferruginibacter sp.]HMP19495.1 BamA/TamA family outer membrane protein [Ferruginibacter sp.]